MNLRYLRNSKNLSQGALAEALELNRGNIASYEKGTAEPNLSNLLKIARFFDADPFELVESDLEQNRKVLINLSKSLVSDEQVPANGLVVTDQLQEKLTINNNQLQHFKRKSDEMMKILEGFRQFHKYKMESRGELSEDVRRMAMDYERLLEVLDEVLKSNKKLMEIIEH